MIARLLRTTLLVVLIFSAKDAVAATTHYISKTLGADTNNGTSKTTPWAHLPGMPSCTSTCASYGPGAGDQFILYGGDSWTSTDLGVNWTWNGSSGSPIYIGVDQTWYSGSAWSRPIFNCGNTAVASTQYGAVIWVAGNYVTFDNIEVTGFQQQNSGGGAVFEVYGNSDTIENSYIHGFSRTSGSSGSNSFAIEDNWSGGAGAGAVFDHNVIDGSDSPNKDFMGGILHGVTVSNNVIRYVYNGMNGVFNDVHSNFVGPNYVSTSGDHCNLVFIQGTFSGTTLLAYNNVITNPGGCSGGSTLWLLGNGGCSSVCNTYAFNNVIYDTSVGFDPQGIIIAGHGANGNMGTFYVFNNTIDPGGDCMGSGDTGGVNIGTVLLSNNHCVSGGNLCLSTAVTCTNSGGNLQQTQAQADANSSPHFDQYTDTQTNAFSPVAGTNSTVVQGINEQLLCTTITLLNATAGAACKNDATYPSYNTSSHTVVTRSVNARPATTAWDIGAYQYSSSQVQALQPPTSLQAIVQ
ncbi:MAG: hypothetical protein WA857_06060 [Candidatus Acidiferrum sp.]